MVLVSLMLAFFPLIAKEQELNMNNMKWNPYGKSVKITKTRDNSWIKATFDDSATVNCFRKGMAALFKPGLKVGKNEVICFDLEASPGLQFLECYIQEIDGDLWKIKIENSQGRQIVQLPVSGFRYGWNENGNKNSQKIFDKPLKYIYIIGYKEVKVNLKKNYFIEIGNISIKPQDCLSFLQDRKKTRRQTVKADFSNLDAKGNFVDASGKEFFPIGIYTVIGIDEASSQYVKFDGEYSPRITDKWLTVIKKAGFNFVQTYCLQFYGMKKKKATVQKDTRKLIEGTKKYLDILRKHDLKGIVYIYHSRSHEKRKEHIRDIVSAVKNNPALFGYYIADEPEMHGMTVNNFRDYCDELKKYDKKHPSIIVCCYKWGTEKFGPYTDIMAVDPYLLMNKYPWWEGINHVKAIEKLPETTHPLAFYVVEAFTGGKRPFPSFQELYMETYLALCRDVRGFIFYIFGRMNVVPYYVSHPKDWNNISKVVNSLKILNPALLSNEIFTNYSISGKNIFSIMKKASENGKSCFYLLAVNPVKDMLGNGVVYKKVKISVGNLKLNSKVSVTALHEGENGKFVLNGKRKIGMFDSKGFNFHTDFNKLAVHVYKIEQEN